MGFICDKLLVSHRFGIIRYLDFLQGITFFYARLLSFVLIYQKLEGWKVDHNIGTSGIGVVFQTEVFDKAAQKNICFYAFFEV